ncbi:hypothetical protein ACHAWF_006161 [Thalassiosira exigua]
MMNSEEHDESTTAHPSNDLIVDEGFAVLDDFKHAGDCNKCPIPRYSFASYANALSMPSHAYRDTLVADCSLVFTARTREDSEGYSTGSTFFLPCLMKPRCALESLAQTIFHAHVHSLEKWEPQKGGEKRLLYDPERSGAEWWTLVLDTPSNNKMPSNGDDENSDNEDDDEGDDDDEVGMHFDADYGLEESLPDFTLHPRVATITYLSDSGVPTLILDKRSPPPSDKDKKSLNGSISKAWLSHPCFGKHVAFDGRYLHGAPGEYFPSAQKKPAADTSKSVEPDRKKPKLEGKRDDFTGKRVTFMVNIWLNHCPLESEPLDDDLVSRLSTPWKNVIGDDAKSNLKEGDLISSSLEWNVKDITAPDKLCKPVSLSKAQRDTSQGPAGAEESIICHRHVDLLFGASMDDFHAVSTTAAREGSLPIDLEDGVMCLKVGREATSDDDESG